MGLFSFLKEAASEANEEAHGSRLLDETQRMFLAMERFDGKLQHIAMCGFLEILDKLHREIPNHSREGRIKLGQIMQKQARERFDLDMAGSTAKLLAGIWLESKERTSLQAQQAHSLLEKFSEYVINEVGEVSTGQVVPGRVSLKRAEPSSQSDQEGIYDLISNCLVLPLALHYRKEGTKLADYITDITWDDEEISWRIYCIAFGMIDAVTQMKGMSQTEHLALATMFFVSKMDDGPEQAADIVGRLIRIKQDSPMFRYIYEGGLAMSNYGKDQELDEFFKLAELLER